MSDVSEYWSRHLAAIETERITTKAYAEREGLSVAALYQRRKQLKGRGQAKAVTVQAGRFVAVEVSEVAGSMGCCVQIGAGVRLELAHLPHPEWLAAVAAAVDRPGR